MMRFETAIQADVFPDVPDFQEAMQTYSAAMRHHALAADETGDIPAGIWTTIRPDVANTAFLREEDGCAFGNISNVGWAAGFERLGFGDPALTIAMCGPGLSYPPIDGLATHQQRVDLFRRFHSQRPVWGAFAITEPSAGSDATAISTTARKVSGGYRINGEKCFITNGQRADFTIVFANTDARRGRFGIRAFVVERDTPGFDVTRVEDMHGLRASQLAQLSFVDCFVPDDCMLGAGAETRSVSLDAFSAAQASWNFMRPILACIMIGTSRAIVEETRRSLLAGERTTNLGRDEIQSRLQRLDVLIEFARALAYRAIADRENDQDASMHAAMAKTKAARLAQEASESALGILLPAAWQSQPLFEKWRRDVIAFSIMEGTDDMQVNNIVRASVRRR